MKNSERFFDEKALNRAISMFRSGEEFSEKTIKALKDHILDSFLTRQYFTRGKHALVLPAWLLGLLGPDGEGMHGIAAATGLTNTDLRSYHALGSPRSEEEPVIDHRGGIIPRARPHSYTIIFGTVINGRPFYSSEVGEVTLEYEKGTATVYYEVDGDVLVYDVYADRDEDGNEAIAINIVRGFANHPLLVTIIPMDQDGITKINSISYDSKMQLVSFHDVSLPKIRIDETPIRVTALPISRGHAGRLVVESTHNSETVECPAGLASWAAHFPVRATPLLTVILDGNPPEYFPDFEDIRFDWEDLMDERLPEISTSNEDVDNYFIESSIVLRLLADVKKGIITMGPSVQEKLWLPALVFQTRALDRTGFSYDVVRPILENIHHFIDSNGVVENNKQYDSQGALVIALINHYYRTQDTSFIGDKYSAIKRVAEWVIRQRKKTEDEADIPEEISGLLLAGHASWFNPLYWKLDYFYSHNFWTAGLLEWVIDLSRELGKHADAEKYNPELDKFRQDLDDSITSLAERYNYLPAGPYQRDNSQMIFNLSAYYPLKLYQPAFQPLYNTVKWLWDNYCHTGGMLIDNPWNSYGSYFSMLIAQAWRYLGESNKVEEVINFLVENATNKSGWAEGISPLTRLGSVGDSPNGYAAAEFVNLVLDLFAEDNRNGPPILLKGIPVTWLEKGVKAANLQLYYESSLDIEAELVDNIFSVKWDYDNPHKSTNPILFIPFPAKQLPNDVEQLSTNEIRLNATSGEITLELIKE